MQLNSNLQNFLSTVKKRLTALRNTALLSPAYEICYVGTLMLALILSHLLYIKLKNY